MLDDYHELEHNIHNGCIEQSPAERNQTELLVRRNSWRSIRLGHLGPIAVRHGPASDPQGPPANRHGNYYRGVCKRRSCSWNYDE